MRAMLATDRGDPRDRLDHAGFVVGQLHRDQRWLRRFAE